MLASEPRVIVLAGPNGAGKSTLASHLIPRNIVFLNADEIAKQLPDTAIHRDREAGRILLHHFEELAAERQSFALETTLASRSLAPRIRSLQTAGYFFELIFVFSPDPQLSVERVAARVRAGGHNIPEEIIRRRYEGGLKNFFQIYCTLSQRWRVYQNVELGPPDLIASGSSGKRVRVKVPKLWKLMQEKAAK